MADLDDFADQVADQSQGIDLFNAGPISTRLSGYVGELTANSLIATAFWEAYFHSPALLRTAQRQGLNPWTLQRSEKIVVSRANRNRFDLVCFAPLPVEVRFRTELVDPDSAELIIGWHALYGGQTLSQNFLISRLPVLGIEALQVGAPFSIIIVPPVSTETTNPPASCQVVRNGPLTSTAGVVARDKSGRDGVTAALHAVGAGSTSVTVGGYSGTVVTSNSVSDSCFVEVSRTIAPAKGRYQGPMRTILPRGSQQATFEGHNSGVRSTVITGWSMELPNATIYSQAKIYTKKDTNPGDSGAALVTDDDFVVGFAFERSAYGSAVDFSSWIWADQVYQALDLTYPP